MQDRPRSTTLQADRPRQDPRESAEVHHARRDDRPQGSRSGQHSRSRSSTCRISATAKTARAASARERAKSAQPIGQAATASDGQGPGRQRSRARTSCEVEVSLEELAEILGDELELPRIEPKGKANVDAGKGPLHEHPPHGPRVAAALQADVHARPCGGRSRRAPTTPTTRWSSRSAKTSAIAPGRRSRSREANAVVIYMMDVSGSMTDEQKEIVRTEAFWIDTWLAQPVRRRRSALHHSRRGGPGGRRRHLLSHARERRHADQLGLQGVPRADRSASFPPSRMEHLLLPVLRRRQLGRRQRAEPASCCATTSAAARATCSATARSKAPTAAASTSASCGAAFGDEHEKLVLSEIENKEAIYDSIKKFLGQRESNESSVTSAAVARCASEPRHRRCTTDH